MGDAFDALVACGLGDAVDHHRFVHLIGNLFDHNGIAVFPDLFDDRFRPHDHRSAPFKVRLARARPTKDQPACGEIRGGDKLDHFLRGQVGIVDQRQRRVDHLAQIMRRDIRGHANSNAAGAIDQHIGKTRGQDGGFAVLAVIVILKIDRVLVDIHQHICGRLVHPHFGIAHGGGTVAVHRPEIALTIQQGQRHGKILRHPYQSVIDRAIAVRVVFTHHIPDGPRGFAIAFVVGVSGLVHAV